MARLREPREPVSAVPAALTDLRLFVEAFGLPEASAEMRESARQHAASNPPDTPAEALATLRLVAATALQRACRLLVAGVSRERLERVYGAERASLAERIVADAGWSVGAGG